MTKAEIPETAAEVTERYLELAQEAGVAPAGLYLTGSVALGDFRDGLSNINFVAVNDAAPPREELAALAEVHKTLRTEYPQPWFSGIYVTWADLAANPADIGKVHGQIEGHWGSVGYAEANPAVWTTLRNHPLAVRGPEAPAVWCDPAVFRRWNLERINTFWRSWLSRNEDKPMTAQALLFCIPGVLRAHYGVAKGDVCSKSGACQHGFTAIADVWHGPIQDALELRTGLRSPDGRPYQKGQKALALIRLLIADANKML
jgi:hypothetical protein